MSDFDQQKWDQRYRQGSYKARTWPSPFLVNWLPTLSLPTSPQALDIGCGAGRNAVYMAQQGLSVTGCDISEVALDRARETASAQHLAITFDSMDLDTQTPVAQSWDLVVMIRYMNRRLQPALASLLRPRGFLLVEHHVTTSEDVTGPPPADDDGFRLRPNELLRDCCELHIIHYSEQSRVDQNGNREALAQLVASPSPRLIAAATST